MNDFDARPMMTSLARVLDRQSLELEREMADTFEPSLHHALATAAVLARAAAEELATAGGHSEVEADLPATPRDAFRCCLERLPLGGARDLVLQRYLDIRAALDDVAFHRLASRTAPENFHATGTDEETNQPRHDRSHQSRDADGAGIRRRR